MPSWASPPETQEWPSRCGQHPNRIGPWGQRRSACHPQTGSRRGRTGPHWKADGSDGEIHGKCSRGHPGAGGDQEGHDQGWWAEVTTIPQWEEPLRLYKVARVQVISPGLGFRASGPVLSHLSMRSIYKVAGLQQAPGGPLERADHRGWACSGLRLWKLAFVDAVLTPMNYAVPVLHVTQLSHPLDPQGLSRT